MTSTTADTSAPTILPIGYRTVGDVKVRVAESQGPAEATVLLTSPWPESVYAFAPIWASLAERFHLFAVDLPGFGGSERRADLLSPTSMGAFLVRLIDECGLGRPHVVAPDIGTSAALFAAASSPDSVASLVVGSGGVAVPIALGEPLRGWTLDPDLDRFRALDPAGIVGAALDTVRGHAFPPAIRDDYVVSYAGDRFVESMAYVRRYSGDLPRLAEMLGGITTPVLVFAGAHDRVVPIANAEYLVARLPHSRQVTVEAGHFVWEEMPGEFAALVANWVNPAETSTHGGQA